MSNFKITAKVPTVYQRTSLTHFGLPITKHGSGSFSICEEFETKEEAEQYLRQRAEMYIENETELNEALEEIEKYGVLELDAATARIEEVDEEENN
jgi:hypothetical protein